MSKAIVQHTTRIAINLIVEDDTGNVTELLTTLTALVSLLAGVSQFIAKTIIFFGDLLESAQFTFKVFCIGVNSLAFGLGVTR